MYKRTKERVHFIGIGGIGMSGIAEVLFRLGFPVSGSDTNDSETIKKLRSLGLKIFIGHKASNLEEAKVVVQSSAIKKENPEILEAQRRGLPIVPRAEMLAELMRLKFGIAVAGTHGKTTTTSMLASIAFHAGSDPTIIIGGKVDALGGNAKLGSGPYLIAEADESDGSFLRLSPVVNLITNIDNDHLDYYGQMELLRKSFLEFTSKIPYYGRNIICLDDLEIQKLIPLISKPTWTYGFNPNSQFSIRNYHQSGIGSEFEIFRDNSKLAKIKLQVPGMHNARNATAAFAAAVELDLDLEKSAEALAQFKGVQRRFELKGTFKDATIVDDYGHHPTEIEATLEAARSYWKGKIVVTFQPHRYSRTQMCWNQFKDSFKNADEIYLVDIYSAGESEIPGITSKNLSQEIPRAQYLGSLDQAKEHLSKNLTKGTLLITLGAGSITQLGPMLIHS